MNRKVLLIEPNYKNKYPPMGLMKIATYYRRCGDDVRFFKGDLKKFAAQLLCEEYFEEIENDGLKKYFSNFVEFIKTGKYIYLNQIPSFSESTEEHTLKEYRLRFKEGNYTKFDVICVATLFTFYWDKIIETINFSKNFCKEGGNVYVGGIAATILPEYIYRETGIKPHIGLLDKPGVFDKDNADIIDELPLDYSILEELDYEYPANNAYFGYMTRGCPRNCAFCAVKTLEPKYKDYIGLKKQLQYVDEVFGPQKDLLLMDNNVFASKSFNKIVDEIKECGFAKGATYVPANDYEVAIENLKKGFNKRGYIKKIVKIYDKIAAKLSEEEAGNFYRVRESLGLLYVETATKENIIAFDKIVGDLYKKLFRKLKRVRYIDFNQGLDARLATDEKMKRLSEINIKPLRIAFDHYEDRDIYVKAVKLAAKHGIQDLSNYLLYNFEDKPEELYHRMRINVELCEELGVTIYSFPMKYHPISDPKYFRNRDYIGKYWNRKFIRAIQAVLNSTKGKIGKGLEFFKEAFGKDVNEFEKILWMPETFIIYRRMYDAGLRERLERRYTAHSENDCDLANEWWEKFTSLNAEEQQKAKNIIAANKFDDGDYVCDEVKVKEVLEYYTIKRK